MTKLAIITTHPIQYYAPIFKLLAKELALKVFYTAGDLSLDKYDPGFQQKIEWVRLKKNHPDAFEEAKRYEKNALEHGSPFTWSDRESLVELEQPERTAAIEQEHEKRMARARAKIRPNPLRSADEQLPGLAMEEVFSSTSKACLICHK